MKKTSEEIFSEQFDIVLNKFANTKETIFYGMNPRPLMENEYQKFKDNKDMFGDYLTLESVSEKYFYIHDIVVLETFLPVLDATKTILLETTNSDMIPYGTKVKFNNSEELIESSIKSRIFKDYKWKQAGKNAAQFMSVAAITQAVTQATVWYASAGAGLVAILLPALFTSPDFNRSIRRNIGKTFTAIGDLFKMVFTLDIKDAHLFEEILDNFDVSPDVIDMFKNHKAGDIMAIPKKCKIDIENTYRVKLGVDVHVTNRSIVRKIINWLFNADTDERAIYDYRKCILTKLIDLYKLQFAGLFTSYYEHERSLDEIETNSRMKEILRYFGKLAKVDADFRQQFELLVRLRNLLEEYNDIMAEGVRIHGRQQHSNIYREYDNTEFTNMRSLQIWLDKELNGLDQSVQKSVKESIGITDRDTKEEELLNKPEEKETLLSDEEKARIEKEKEEEALKKDKEIDDKNPMDALFKNRTSDDKEKKEDTTPEYWKSK